jgi:hypothetical protein
MTITNENNDLLEEGADGCGLYADGCGRSAGEHDADGRRTVVDGSAQPTVPTQPTGTEAQSTPAHGSVSDDGDAEWTDEP